MRRGILFELFFEPTGIYFTGYVIGIIDDRLEKWDAGIDALNLECANACFVRAMAWCDPHHGLSALPIGNHKKAERNNPNSNGYPANAGAIRCLPMGDAPGTRTKSMLRRLGVDAAFDGMTEEANIGLFKRQRFTARDPQLLRHEVDSGDHFRHGMFHLNARVHLEKEKLVGVVVKDKFHRAGVLITDASRQDRPRRYRFGLELPVDTA